MFCCVVVYNFVVFSFNHIFISLSLTYLNSQTVYSGVRIYPCGIAVENLSFSRGELTFYPIKRSYDVLG